MIAHMALGGSIPLQIGASASNVFGYGNTNSPSIVSNTTTITESNGTGPYTYLWSFVSGPGSPFTISNPTAATVSWSMVPVTAGTFTQTWICTGNDARGNRGTITISVVMNVSQGFNY